MMQLVSFAKEFNAFARQNSLALSELEQANFIAVARSSLNLSNIVRNVISTQFYELYKGIIFSDLDYFIERIQLSHYSFIEKKHMMLLLIASRSEKYANTLSGNLSESERRFLLSYLKKSKDFVNYVLEREHKDEIAIFLHDLNAFKKYLKKDEFLLPGKIQNAFNWLKNADAIDLKARLESTQKSLFLSRRKYYDKLDLHSDTVREYKNFAKKFKNILKSQNP